MSKIPRVYPSRPAGDILRRNFVYIRTIFMRCGNFKGISPVFPIMSVGIFPSCLWEFPSISGIFPSCLWAFPSISQHFVVFSHRVCGHFPAFPGIFPSCLWAFPSILWHFPGLSVGIIRTKPGVTANMAVTVYHAE